MFIASAHLWPATVCYEADSHFAPEYIQPENEELRHSRRRTRASPSGLLSIIQRVDRFLRKSRGGRDAGDLGKVAAGLPGFRSKGVSS